MFSEEAQGFVALRMNDNPGAYKTLLDVGCGDKDIAAVFSKMGLRVLTVDINSAHNPNYTLDLSEKIPMSSPMPEKVDIVWASHVLEHVKNPDRFLRNLSMLARYWVVVTVPPMKDTIVGGHRNLYTKELLVYQFMLAGYNMQSAYVWEYGYNISVCAQPAKKIPTAVLRDLVHDSGDIEALDDYWPISWKREGDTMPPRQPVISPLPF